jgi:hypothetical protein
MSRKDFQQYLQAVLADGPNYLDTSRSALLVVEEENIAFSTTAAASSAG